MSRPILPNRTDNVDYHLRDHVGHQTYVLSGELFTLKMINTKYINRLTCFFTFSIPPQLSFSRLISVGSYVPACLVRPRQKTRNRHVVLSMKPPTKGPILPSSAASSSGPVRGLAWPEAPRHGSHPCLRSLIPDLSLMAPPSYNASGWAHGRSKFSKL